MCGTAVAMPVTLEDAFRRLKLSRVINDDVRSTNSFFAGNLVNDDAADDIER